MKKRRTIIVGLTGSIGMGKSTVSGFFEKLGVPVFSADQTVHALLAAGGRAEKKIRKLFPEALTGQTLDRAKLGALLFADPDKRKNVESILHPMVWSERRAFLRAHKDKKIVVCDIPLLFETGADKDCDLTLCVYAPRAVQKQRVMKRKNMTPKKFRAIVKSQMPDAEKKRRASIVLRTDLPLAQTRADVKRIVSFLMNEGFEDA